MVRKKCIVILKNSEGIKKEEEIINIDEEKKYFYYIETDKEKTVNIYDYNRNILKRDNNKLYLELEFKEKKNTIGILRDKELKKELKLDINTTKLKHNEEKLEIEYEIEKEKFKYIIEKGEEL